MVENKSSLSQIRKIDNTRHWLPLVTIILLFFLIYLFVWFLRGGSYRLYTSIFFSIYFVTHQIWLSVILIGVFQNIIFMPLRLIGNILKKPLEDFEEELDKTEDKQQLLVFSKKVKEGNTAIVFYIFNFFVNAIAFFSAARIFLVDFYNYPLDRQKFLYSWVPYPKYPLNGTIFKFPFFKVTNTTALPWNTIFIIVGSFLLLTIVLRLIWRLVRFLFKKNQKILYARIRYNRFLLFIGGFSGVFVLGLVLLLRNIPTAFQGLLLRVDLTRPNPPMNFVTAVGTFLTTLHAGYKNHSFASKQAKLAGIDPKVVNKVFLGKMQNSFKNALILGAGAFFITNQIPSAFELSVVTFEIMYMIYPYTLGRLLTLGTKKVKKLETQNVPTT